MFCDVFVYLINPIISSFLGGLLAVLLCDYMKTENGKIKIEAFKKAIYIFKEEIKKECYKEDKSPLVSREIVNEYDDIICEIRSKSENIEFDKEKSTFSDFDREELVEMAENLILTTKKIAGAIQGGDNVKTDQLLQDVPDFMSKITKLDKEELEKILSSATKDLCVSFNQKEKEELLNTLDNLTK